METAPQPAPETGIPPATYDTPWKIALEQHFQAFMAFYFPLAHGQIDWSVKHEFLDKEFQAIAKDDLIGTRHVDKLVKVRLLSGAEDWLCIHVEVQVSRVPEFAKRMFVYNYRIFDRYDRPAASMALLGDDAPNWKPQHYGYKVMGCEMGIRFPVVKLADYAGQEAALMANPNPFALITLAWVKNRATATDMPARFEVKCNVVRLLHAHGWDAALIRQLFLVIDWMMALPPELASKLTTFVTKLEEEQKMEYVSSVERVREQWIYEAGETAAVGRLLQRLLTHRFGDLPQAVQDRIKTADRQQAEGWLDRVIDAATLDEVFRDMAH